MVQPEKPFSIGETQPIIYPDHTQGVATLIEIIVLPDDSNERQTILDQTYKRLQTEENIAMITGKNLADDPILAPRVNQNALYIFES